MPLFASLCVILRTNIQAIEESVSFAEKGWVFRWNNCMHNIAISCGKITVTFQKMRENASYCAPVQKDYDNAP